MTDRVEIAGAMVSAILMVVVIELVRRRKLTEEYSLLWILAALGLFGLSFSRPMIASHCRLAGHLLSAGNSAARVGRQRVRRAALFLGRRLAATTAD